jgi:hypothetical protein
MPRPVLHVAPGWLEKKTQEHSRYRHFFPHRVRAPHVDTIKTAIGIGRLMQSTFSQRNGRSDVVWVVFMVPRVLPQMAMLFYVHVAMPKWLS